MKPSTANTNANAPGLIAPRLCVIAAIIVGLAGLTFLIPDRDQLFKRFLTDGDASAANELLSGENSKSPAAVTTTLTRELLTLGHRSHWNPSTVDIFTGFLDRHEDFATAADLIVADAESIPEEPRHQILCALIDRSLAEADMDRAVAIQSQLISLSKQLTPELVRQAVRTYRFNGQPGTALDLINRLQDQSAELPEDLRSIRVTLARETSQPDIAYNLLAIKIRASRNPAEIKTLIPEAIKIGVEAGYLEQLIPLYRRYIAMFRKTEDPLVAEYSMKIAQTLEWTGHAEQAFETYLTLGKEGNVEALERCVKLNAGLYRPADLLSALLAAETHLGDDNPFLLTTAQLLAEASDHNNAITLYERHLANNPDDSDALYRLGLIHDQCQNFKAAIPPFTRAHELDPTNVGIASRLASVCIAQQEYELARKHFRALSLISDDPDHAEQYSAIAYALGDDEGYREAIARILELHPKPSFAIGLAASYREAGDHSQAIAILSDSLHRNPDEVAVRTNLATLHILAKRPDEALKTLKPLSLSKHPDIIPTIVDALGALSISPYAKQIPAALSTYGAALAQAPNFPPNNLVDLAGLEKQYGSHTRSTTLLRRALRECSLPNHLAQAHFHLGNPRQALHQQLAYIKQAPRPVSEDYHFLGDVYSALDQESNASSAYNYAVVLLRQKLTRSPQR